MNCQMIHNECGEVADAVIDNGSITGRLHSISKNSFKVAGFMRVYSEIWLFPLKKSIWSL